MPQYTAYRRPPDLKGYRFTGEYRKPVPGEFWHTNDTQTVYEMGKKIPSSWDERRRWILEKEEPDPLGDFEFPAVCGCGHGAGSHLSGAGQCLQVSCDCEQFLNTADQVFGDPVTEDWPEKGLYRPQWYESDESRQHSSAPTPDENLWASNGVHHSETLSGAMAAAKKWSTDGYCKTSRVVLEDEDGNVLDVVWESNQEHPF